MTEFVDPRSNPEPPPRISREPAVHGEALRERVSLCWVGRVYDVERWIQEGWPIQALANRRLKKPSLRPDDRSLNEVWCQIRHGPESLRPDDFNEVRPHGAQGGHSPVSTLGKFMWRRAEPACSRNQLAGRGGSAR
jgi:hypothetical protein